MRAFHGLAAALAIGGCASPASPSVPLFGAYFPSWLICLAAGVIGAVLVRMALIRLGIDELIPLRFLVYASMGVLIATILAITVYGR